MKIIFEQVELDTIEKQEFAKKNFPNYRKAKQEILENYFEIMITDFPIWLRDGVTIWSDLLYFEDKLAKNCKLISGNIPFELEGCYIVDCERIERYKGEIVQRVWIAFLG